MKQRTTFHEGRGRIVDLEGDPKVVEVTGPDGTTTRVEGRHVVIATGLGAAVAPGLEIDGEVVMTSDQALWFREAPRRVVIIGAGAIGMEFASMWHPMGSEVTVVEALDRVLPLEDPDSSKAVARAFKKKGIDCLTGAMVKDVAVADGAATVSVEFAGSVIELEADVVLVAIGRGPNTADVGADAVLDERGFVRADAFGRTEVDGVWGVGDVLPTLALAHAGFAEGFRVADVIAGVEHVQPVDYAQVPRVTYCHPEVASVGLTEAEARERYGDDGVTATTYSLKANAKAIIAGTDGFVKVLSRTGEDGPVVGVHVVGPHATDIIAEATLATEWGALPEELAAITHAHPTLYEAMGEAFMAAAGVPSTATDGSRLRPPADPGEGRGRQRAQHRRRDPRRPRPGAAARQGRGDARLPQVGSAVPRGHRRRAAWRRDTGVAPARARPVDVAVGRARPVVGADLPRGAARRHRRAVPPGDGGPP